ncbi:hypothetical protein D3C87_1209100 [compost metagenome]
MGDVDQHLRREIGAARYVGGKGLRIDQRRRALGHGFGDLRTDEKRRARRHQWTECGGVVQRIAQHVLAGQFGETLDKLRIDFLVDVDAFDRAAALPGIEETAVHQILYCMLKVGICAHVSRVFAAKLQAQAEKSCAGGVFHDFAGLYRAGEVHLLHPPGGNDRPGRHMVEQQILEQPFGQIGAAHGFGETLAHQQRLRSMFEDHAVAGHQRRDDRVDRGQVGVIPRRDYQHRAQRFTFDLPSKAGDGRGFKCGQRVMRNTDHVPRPLFETAQLARAIAHRAAHLPGQFRDDFGFHGQHRVHGGAAKSRAFAQWPAPPLRLGGGGCRQSLFDLCRIGALTFGINPAIDRRDELNRCCHDRLNSARSRVAIPSQ